MRYNFYVEKDGARIFSVEMPGEAGSPVSAFMQAAIAKFEAESPVASQLEANLLFGIECA